MKRVYNDERFPGLEVVNFGETLFRVLREGQQIDEFSSYEGQCEQVSEGYAQRRAFDYFNRMADHADGLGEAQVKLPHAEEDIAVPEQIVNFLLEN